MFFSLDDINKVGLVWAYDWAFNDCLVHKRLHLLIPFSPLLSINYETISTHSWHHGMQILWSAVWGGPKMNLGSHDDGLLLVKLILSLCQWRKSCLVHYYLMMIVMESPTLSTTEAQHHERFCMWLGDLCIVSWNMHKTCCASYKFAWFFRWNGLPGVSFHFCFHGFSVSLFISVHISWSRQEILKHLVLYGLLWLCIISEATLSELVGSSWLSESTYFYFLIRW